jgi:DinB family protein
VAQEIASNIATGRIHMKTILGVLVSSLLSVPLAAQTAPQAPPKDLSAWLRNSYATNRKFLARTAEKMPEEFYSLRPGPQTEVRTFGQIIGHLANFNFRWCSDAKGEKNPMETTDFEKLTDKASLVKGLNIALTYCDSAYAMVTDANAMDVVQGTTDEGTKVRVLRISRLISNLAHNNEHYGNLVTYMRMKSIVPPSSEPR